jgi:ketosteroid isomerase-like protein
MAAVATHYTEDAVVLPPGAEMIKGRSAIQSFWKGAAEQIGDIRLTAVDVKPLGTDAAREIGTFSLKTKDQQPQEITGKYVVVWEKVGGDWKLATDIWNTNK